MLSLKPAACHPSPSGCIPAATKSHKTCQRHIEQRNTLTTLSILFTHPLLSKYKGSPALQQDETERGRSRQERRCPGERLMKDHSQEKRGQKINGGAQEHCAAVTPCWGQLPTALCLHPAPAAQEHTASLRCKCKSHFQSKRLCATSPLPLPSVRLSTHLPEGVHHASGTFISPTLNKDILKALEIIELTTSPKVGMKTTIFPLW